MSHSEAPIDNGTPNQAQTEDEIALTDEMMAVLQQSQHGLDAAFASLMPPEPIAAQPATQSHSVVDAIEDLPEEFFDLLQESQGLSNEMPAPAAEAQVAKVNSVDELPADFFALLQESQLGAAPTSTQAPAIAHSVDELPDEFLALMQESQLGFAQTEVKQAPPHMAASAAISQDLHEIFARGGLPALSLMQYCVRSMNFDPLFVVLVREYQMRPSHVALLALYDTFCAPQALARLSVTDLLAAHELRMQAQVAVVRQEWQRAQQPPTPVAEGEEAPRQRTTVPYRSIFDGLLRALQHAEDGSWQKVQRSYDPEKSVNQNLPGGDMSMAQRQFVTRVWQPQLRPRLVAAGFWRLATVE